MNERQSYDCFWADPPTEFTLNLIGQIVGDIVLGDSSLNEKLMQLALPFLTEEKNRKTAFQLVLALVSKQNVEMSDELMVKLFSLEGNEAFILELIKTGALKPDVIEARLLSETRIDTSTLRFVEAYLQKRNDLSDGVKRLPLLGEELLWNFVMRPSDVNARITEVLCGLYTDNDQAVLPSRTMIEIFLQNGNHTFGLIPIRKRNFLSCFINL